MRAETFFSYRNYRWLWANAALLAILITIYFLDQPVGGRNGATVVGYTYGAIATAGILYLMWYGIRKRSYRTRGTTVKGCLSAHVWLGLSLAVVVPLHAGFYFGWNVHTAAYSLMMIVVISGIFGAVKYGELAPEIQSHRGGASMKKLIEQRLLLTDELHALSVKKGPQFAELLQKVDIDFRPSLWKALRGQRPRPPTADETTELLAKLPALEYDDGLKLIDLAMRKKGRQRRFLKKLGL